MYSKSVVGRQYWHYITANYKQKGISKCAVYVNQILEHSIDGTSAIKCSNIKNCDEKMICLQQTDRVWEE